MDRNYSINILDKKKRYAHLIDENLRNFQISKDSIVALTLQAWAAISPHLLIRFSQDLHLKRGIAAPRFLHK